ncbi:MAG TPA: nitroreductase family deazaflavin-dependent oxidoreductase [Acidimicrobiales bacterium]|jgi:deazaflavin-dependent oxidoreductase (nitroreductase family)|nr:nitroreductase family deazaflavin-dependent oxidoreductase [Acidimicrobiales bacterium]
MAAAADRNAGIIAEFRANAGRVGGPFEGAPLLLLTTTGARSGRVRVKPMMYLDLDGRLYVFGSKGGAPTNPDWYHNLVAHPTASVEVGTEAYEVTATVLEGAERERVFAEQARRYPAFAEYQAGTERTIPVVALDRR